MPESDNEGAASPRIPILATLAALVAAALFWLLSTFSDAFAWKVGFQLSQVCLISIIIWQACDPFADAAQWIGQTFRVPGSVRGATLDAVASSMPELFSGIFFVVVATAAADSAAAVQEAGGEGYGATLATCAGSAIYNMILIPAFCALVISFSRKSRPTIEVESKVISRDGMWFVGCEFVFIAFLWQSTMQWWMALVFIGIYGLYIFKLYLDARAFRRAGQRDDEDGDEDGGQPETARILFAMFQVPLNHYTAWGVILMSTLVTGVACYWLVSVTRATAEQLDIPVFFVAVILAAAASSVPDTFLSIGAATRGDDSGAVSNAFGSNIFDICICMAIPLLVNSYLNGWQPVRLMHDGKPIAGLVGIRILLCVLTLVTLLIMWHKHQLTRTKALVLCALYALFVAYAVAGSLGWGFFGIGL
jgi:cation:H+ antiporter